MIRAFTGPAKLHRRQQRWVAMRMLAMQPIADVWRSGCALGVDSIAAWLAVAVGAELELYVPAAFHNGNMVDQLNLTAARIVHCGRMPSAVDSYRRRNEQLVAGIDQLGAFVWNEKFYRSGEWMTINIARRAGVEIITHTIPGVRA